MESYLHHLEAQYSPKSFARKLQYIEHNVGAFLKPGLTVLEAGPGFGEFIECLKRHGSTDVDVLDRDEGVIGLLRSRYPLRNTWTTPIEQIADLEGALRRYDLIYLSEILEHVRKDAIVEVIRRLYACLKPGGAILIVAPNGGNPLCAVERYADFTHEMAFSVNALRQILDMAGIPRENLSVSGYRIPPASPLNLIRIALQKLLHLCLWGIMIVNGANFSRILEPNLCAVIRRTSPG